MKDFHTLKLLDRFEKAFTRFGIDYKVMRKLLQVKLTMDGRRVPTIFQQNRKKKKDEQDESNQYLKSLWFYAFLGLFMIPFIIMGDNYIFQMSFIFGILMFIVMTSIISDFSSVLLDIRDRNILLPKPIDKKTISAAKMIHVTIYLCFLTGSIVSIPLIVGLFKNGFTFFFVSVIAIIMIDMLIVVLTALIYILILKFFDGEKLKDIINYVQIGLSLAIMIGYQLLARSFELMDVTVVLEPQWWQVFIFPIWYGAMVEIVMKGDFHPFYLLLSILGIIIPIIAIWIYGRLVPAFEKNLQKLSFHGQAKIPKRHKLVEWLVNRICVTKEERAFFRFAGIMMKNERDFKLKVYPSLGFAIVIPFIFLYNSISFNDSLDTSTSKAYFTIYFSMIVIPMVVMMLKYSGKYKGAWIYKVSPIQQLNPIFSGTMKVFIVKLYIPLYLLLSVIFIGIFGIRIVPDLAIVFLNACMYSLICFLIFEKALPFSESFDKSNQTGGFIIFVSMLIIPIFAGLHYASTFISYGLYIYLLLAVVILMLLWRNVFKLTWESLRG